MWKEVTDTEPKSGDFYTTKIEPQENEMDVQRLYLHPKMGWITSGVYDRVLFVPTYWFDYSIKNDI